MTRINRQWRIVERPIGRIVRDSDFRWTEAQIQDPRAGEVLVRTLYLAFDPSQKVHMENAASYAAPIEIGEVMKGRGLGEVISSKDPGFGPGDKVTGFLGWQDYATLPAGELLKVADDDLLTANLGVLGSTGLTAFLGLKHVGRPYPGDTVVVTGAAGATGSVAGQLAKLAGCRVIGIAGGQAKCRWLKEDLGFDEALDHRAVGLAERLAPLVADGIDVLWDNVGGAQLDLLLQHLATGARVVLCGAISRYATPDLPPGPRNYFNLVFRRATMQGFLTGTYKAEYPVARRLLRQWLAAGQLKHREDIQEGLENAPRTLARLFEGANFGKQLLRLNVS
jgi:NADPH-dependent curcumin reductase CurA